MKIYDTHITRERLNKIERFIEKMNKKGIKIEIEEKNEIPQTGVTMFYISIRIKSPISAFTIEDLSKLDELMRGHAPSKPSFPKIPA